jgi:predicted membrane protein
VVEGLGNARCREISLAGGAGSIVLDFTGAWTDAFRSDAEVVVGLGSLTLRLPEDLGVEVRMTRFLASFAKEGFERRGSRYVSPNYDRARAHVQLHVKAALGDIDVEWVPTR